MINLQDLKNPEFWEDKKKYFKLVNNILISYFKWFVTLVVLIVLVVGGLFLVWPKYQEVTSLLESSQQRQQEMIEQKKERLSKLQGIISDYNSISSRQKEKVEQMIPSRQNAEEMFTEFNYLMEENDLKLKSMQIQDGGKEGSDREVNNRKEKKDSNEKEVILDDSLPQGVESREVELLVLGTNYNSLKGLLETLERNLPVVDVVDISFSPEGNTTKLTVRTYQLK